jgi:hypothetical protein
MNGFIEDIGAIATNNTSFRRVLYTAQNGSASV